MTGDYFWIGDHEPELFIPQSGGVIVQITVCAASSYKGTRLSSEPFLTLLRRWRKGKRLGRGARMVAAGYEKHGGTWQRGENSDALD